MFALSGNRHLPPPPEPCRLAKPKLGPQEAGAPVPLPSPRSLPLGFRLFSVPRSGKLVQYMLSGAGSLAEHHVVGLTLW